MIDRREERERLVKELTDDGIRNPAVLAAMRTVPRHRFVPADQQEWAYENSALAIARGQTISQPYVVACMTEAALGDRDRFRRVLEVGTGSGYQAAVLAAVADEVYSVERIDLLLAQARRCLADLSINNIRTKLDDGSDGWLEHGPYEAILVTAAAAEMPSGLIEQLEVGGRMIVPIGAPDDVQELVQVTRTPGGPERKVLTLVRFVPLV